MKKKINPQLRYYYKNKEKINKKRKLYRKHHKEAYNSYMRQYFNRPKVKQYRKKYQKQYRQTANGIYCAIKERCKRLNILLVFSREQFAKWYKNQSQICYYCKRSIQEIKLDKKEKSRWKKQRLSIDRKDSKKGYRLNNIVLSCYRCNAVKGDYFTVKEMLKIAKHLYRR